MGPYPIVRTLSSTNPKTIPRPPRYVLIEIDDISPNRLASIEEVEIQNAAPGIDKS